MASRKPTAHPGLAERPDGFLAQRNLVPLATVEGGHGAEGDVTVGCRVGLDVDLDAEGGLSHRSVRDVELNLGSCPLAAPLEWCGRFGAAGTFTVNVDLIVMVSNPVFNTLV